MKNIFLSLGIILAMLACVSRKPIGSIEPNKRQTGEFSMNMGDSVSKAEVKKELKWLDFESAYVKAQKENKILMVDVYTDWCGWCKVMDRKTFSNDTVQALLNKYFVVAKMNPEKNHIYHMGKDSMSATELHAWLGYGRTFGFPTTYFMLKPGKTEERYSAIGFNESWDFQNILNQIREKNTN